MELIKITTVLILEILSSIFNSKFLKNCSEGLSQNITKTKAKDYIKKIKGYKRQRLILPDELVSLIKKQDNKIYYEYDIITIKENSKENCNLDIIYYFLINGDNTIIEWITNRLYMQGNTPCYRGSLTDTDIVKKWFKKIADLDIRLIDKQKEIEKQERAYERSKAESYYKNALEDYNAGNYESAEEFINLAIDIVDYKKYRSLQEKITSKTFSDDIFEEINIDNDTQILNNKEDHNSRHTSSVKKIKLESCTKADLLNIDGFNEEKAERFIKERKNGKYYYDIETFVSAFELMPHQIVDIQDKLEFPAKPKNKIGRKIDW